MKNRCPAILKSWPLCLMLGAMALATAACSLADPPRNDDTGTEVTEAAAGQGHADTILTGGTIISVDADGSTARALAVRDGRIVAIGDEAEIAALSGPATQRIDLAGRTVIPGFIEGHGHFLGLGEAQLIIDLQDTTRFDELLDRVAAAVADAQPGEWILGRGWHQERWTDDGRPRFDGVPGHQDLSAISPDNPVLLTHASGHASFANAQALALAGIDRDTPDPEGGTIVRDGDGEATGFLRQAAQLMARRALADSEAGRSDEDLEARFLRQVELAGEEALRHGITSFHDQGASFDEIVRLRRLAEAGQLPIRLHMAVRGESNEAMDERLADFRQIGDDQDFLTVRAIKRQIDGALGTHGAWMLAPYSDKPDTAGLPQTPVDSLRRTAEIALEHGFQLNTHAIGDRGAREALDLYEALFAEHEAHDLRWRIEHAQNLNPDEIPRFAELGVIASMQGIHATSDGPWVPQRIGQERARRGAYVWRALIDADAVICNGTDVPVEPISAIASYHASVTRRMPNGEAFFPEQAMTRMEALKSYTINCAYAVFDEHRLGSLEVGKLADLVVLDRNLLEVDDDALAETRVELTMVGGEIRFQHL
ncbi:MAG: amidohydrolase [Wenzhouxiangella sp.]